MTYAVEGQVFKHDAVVLEAGSFGANLTFISRVYTTRNHSVATLESEQAVAHTGGYVWK
jgi:hypothetical protein